MNKPLHVFLLSAIASTSVTARGAEPPVARAAAPAGPKMMSFKLSLAQAVLDPTHPRIASMNFSPSKYDVISERPAGITKEPVYAAKPMYGAFRIGNGPRSVTYFAIDEVVGKDSKLYVDINQNGDLTDDGPGKWDSVKPMDMGQHELNYTTFVKVHASWGTAMKETESGQYTLIVSKREGMDSGGFAKVTGRAGMIKLGDKTYPIVLAENTNDGLYTLPADTDITRGPVTMYIDTDGGPGFDEKAPDGDTAERRSAEKVNINKPFQIDGRWYVAGVSISGAELRVAETDAPGVAELRPKAPESTTPKITSGMAAPDFTVQTSDGKPMSLADFKGKVVVLDLWATWCAPCQASMPGVESIYQSVKDQDVVFLSVNVLDEKAPFDKWIKDNAGSKYHFTFGFDSLPQEDTNSLVNKYGVDGIPSMFVITRDGKIASAMMGGSESDLKKALKAQGILAKQQ